MATPPPDSTSPSPNRRLGRGLDALLAARDLVKPQPATPAPPADSVPESPYAPPAPAASTPATAGPALIPLDQIRPNPLQPRKEFREQDLADLTASLKASGLIQPVSVRPAPSGAGFELIAGERRFRAATALGWTAIPAVVRDVDDQTLLALALVENLQRADLNALDEAEGYERLAKDHALSQQQVAELVGKDRSTVANALRLLGLPDPVKQLVRDGTLSAGHARALLTAGVPSRITTLAAQAASLGWSVRETERHARTSKPAAPPKASATPASANSNSTPTTRRIQQLLTQHLQTDTALHLTGKDRGELRIAFYSADDLQRLLDKLGVHLDD